MAYNRHNNPDALPRFAEPDSAYKTQSSSHSRRDDTYAHKPPPPAPSQRDDRYNAPPRANSNSGYDDRHRDDRRQQGYSSSSRYSGGEPSRAHSYSSAGQRYDQGYSQGRPPPQNISRPPPTPAPPRDGNDRDALRPMFRAVDKERTGHLSERELGAALVNGDYTSFDPHTVKMMIRMFDVDRSGTIDFEEFCGLWGFLSEWRKLFDRFDVDNSGSISYDEFSSALVAFGYRLTPDYVSMLFGTYDSRGRGFLSFDLFVQACISLKRMTDVFKKYDTDRDGYITLSFEEFLTGTHSIFLHNSISARTDNGSY